MPNSVITRPFKNLYHFESKSHSYCLEYRNSLMSKLLVGQISISGSLLFYPLTLMTSRSIILGSRI